MIGKKILNVYSWTRKRETEEGREIDRGKTFPMQYLI